MTTTACLTTTGSKVQQGQLDPPNKDPPKCSQLKALCGQGLTMRIFTFLEEKCDGIVMLNGVCFPAVMSVLFIDLLYESTHLKWN